MHWLPPWWYSDWLTAFEGFLGIPAASEVEKIIRTLCVQYPDLPSFTFTLADVLAMDVDVAIERAKFIAEERRTWAKARR